MERPADQLVEHFFRRESANLIAVLTRAFGYRRIELIEDMVQAAMLEAMHAWKQRGVPDNPAGWIHRTASHRIIDALRREKQHRSAIALTGRSISDAESAVDQWLENEQIPDSLLRMIFVCCHPALERKTQIALTLKTLCGFGVAEIALGLLLPAEAVKKRIQRARNSLAAEDVRLELPDNDQLSSRLDVVHDVLYLMFNEGYSPSSGPAAIRDDICEEAVRLCHLLCESPCSSPVTKALLALLLCHAARLEARTDAEGTAILLEDQDRTKWDRRLISAAQYWLVQSKTDRPTTFHLEAAIAMHHCHAASVDATDWEAVVQLYNRLLQLRDSPIYALNLAIARGQTGDTRAALRQLQSLRDRDDLRDYVFLDCAFARIHELDSCNDLAIDAYLSALSKATAPHQTALIERKLHALTNATSNDKR